MIDIHHHLLFGIDDGPKDILSSIEQAKAAAAEGITHIACTPHANHVFAFRPEINQERLAAIREQLGDQLTLGLGCDFHLSYENIEDALNHPRKYTINQGQYLLVEFADYVIPTMIGNAFHELMSRGMQPIITHPERNLLLQRDFERMAAWIRAGCLVQVTAASLGRRFGKRAYTVAWDLLDRNWVHFVATDAHNMNGRRPCMSEAFQAIEKRLGQETAQRLCVENPLAAFENRDLPAQPEPEGIEEDALAKRGFLSRLFGR